MHGNSVRLRLKSREVWCAHAAVCSRDASTADGSLCESFTNDCTTRLPRVREAGPGRRKQTPGHG